jgi:hypothetical protein
MWRKWSLAAFILSLWLAESDCLPSVMCVDLSHWWYNHATDIVPPSTVLDFIIKIHKKHKPTSPSALQVKNWQKRVGIEEKVGIISQLEKGEPHVGICHNVSTTHSNVCAICDNADRITECGKSGTKVSA